MRQHEKRTAKVFLASILGLALLALALAALLVTTSPAKADTRPNMAALPGRTLLSPELFAPDQQGLITTTPEILDTGSNSGTDLSAPGATFIQTAPPLPEWVAALKQTAESGDVSAAFGAVSIVITAQTPSGDSAVVLNGETITYGITIVNNGSASLDNVIIWNELPENTLETDITYTGGGNLVPSEARPPFVIPKGPGVTEPFTITFVQAITWLVPELQRDSPVTLQYVRKVSCKAEGTSLRSQAFASPGDGISNIIETFVRDSEIKRGLANQPSWCGEEVRGVYDMDWGDFDRDGDLDLAFASTSVGAVVYRNNNGELQKFWPSEVSAFSVHWVDFDGDNNLELLAVGQDGNQIHRYYHGSNGFTPGPLPFLENQQGFRVGAGNFDDDRQLELLIGTRFSGDCVLRLYDSNLAYAGCIQTDTVPAGLAIGDYNNDGHVDLVTNLFGGSPEIRVLTHTGTGLDYANPITVGTNLLKSPYGMTLGDFNTDSFLDLAAAFPRDNPINVVQVYENNGNAGRGFTSVPTIPTKTGYFGPPFSVDWGDFSGNGYLDLAVADEPPIIYQYNPVTKVFTHFQKLPDNLFDRDDLFWKILGADYDNDGDIDLSLTSLENQSMIFPNFAPLLNLSLKPIASFKANSVAWGDVNGDRHLDLLFGAGGVPPGSRLYGNTGGGFQILANYTASGLGPSEAALVDVDRNGNLDVVIAGASVQVGRQTQIYLNGNTASPDWTFNSDSNALAWADFDLSNNGSLDLFIGNNGHNNLFLNAGLQSETSDPIPFVPHNENTRSVAWGYLDDDALPDIAVGNDGAPSRVYRNNGDLTFTEVWSSTLQPTRSVAWGDYDGDGYMDLAVGNYNQPNYIYRNDEGRLLPQPIPLSKNAPQNDLTTSIAWGDWNNDKKPDLAVGNYGEKDRVYANLGSKPGELPNLVVLWESHEAFQTTDLAWGDMDNDGDLDLAISQDGNGQNGVYENTYVLAPHVLGDNFTQAMPLPQNPSYLSIAAPGQPGAVFARTFPYTLSTNLSITIPFTVFDPDGTRAASPASTEGDPVKVLKYEYSLGGDKWYSVDSDYLKSQPTNPLTTTRGGRPSSVVWEAGQELAKKHPDRPVSDNVRFRITIVHLNKTGPTQRASTVAASPPFRVRNIACIWPDEAEIQVQEPIARGVPAVFTGTVPVGQGQVTFRWNFGDESEEKEGQIVAHTYQLLGERRVTLRVEGAVTDGGPGCEDVPRDAVAMKTISVIGPGGATEEIFLPFIAKGPDGSATSAPPSTPELPGPPTPEVSGQALHVALTPGSPRQVTGLTGRVQAGVVLQWESSHPDDGVIGYRVYHANVGQMPYRLLAELPADITTYTDGTSTCGKMYIVTAYNATGESLPSTSSYFTLPCR